jgi:GxxExxY protein
MKKLNPAFLYEDQTYKLNGTLFAAHNELGRFAKERQYGDNIENRLKQKSIPFIREQRIGDVVDIPDFILWDLIVVELKAKPFLQTEDFDQVQRYLHQTGLKLGILINFRAKYLKPQRILKDDNR